MADDHSDCRRAHDRHQRDDLEDRPSTGNPGMLVKDRTGIFVTGGVATLAGCGVAWVNWLISLGRRL